MGYSAGKKLKANIDKLWSLNEMEKTADRRYGTVFVYHNGAESYYAATCFRGLLRV